jgi:hypothetical protein
MKIFDDEPVEFVTGKNKTKGNRKKNSYDKTNVRRSN